MEGYLNQFPQRLTYDHKLCRLTLSHDKELWLVAYQELSTKEWLVFRWNKSLNVALRLMEGLLRSQNLWIEEKSAIDLNQLPS
jgi:hypothetical protein